MKKIMLYIALSFIILFIYIFLIPIKIQKSVFLKAQKVISINSFSKGTRKNIKIDGYFFSQKECGYFSSSNGMVNYFITSNEDEYLVANKYGYIVYNKYGTYITLYSAKGQKIKEIMTYGYPYIKKDFPIFFIITTDGRGLSAYSMQGVLLFGPVKLSSIITSIDSDKFFNVLVSTTDGNVTYYSKDGDIIRTKNFIGDSKINIAKSICISQQKSIFSVCHGIEPEYISILKLENFANIYSIKTQTNFRYENILKFMNNRLYFEGISNGVYQVRYLNLKNKHIHAIEVDGEIDDFQISKSNELLIKSHNNGIEKLDFFYKNGIKKLSYKFSKSVSDFGFINEETIFFKYNNKIYIIKRVVA